MVFRCNDCNHQSPYQQAMKNHFMYTGHTPRFVCEECGGRLFVNAKALQGHLETAVVHCTCLYCDEEPFDTQTELEEHVRYKHTRRCVIDYQPSEHTPLIRREGVKEEDNSSSFSWRILCSCFC
ncbi:hypothetical protein Agabi119p4_3329 [Agaricus bisporus var. burnettii]|uniref:C2H2-type domain-containing protein n=1 Tax=Agaricus bisporus var. burnettii TaxID=192524 RepID=A0A8H7F706_AGABI|nr:hypothetical protein Agabi119p4_3329 [Agaricus bisporus var. burnettii]